MRSADDGAARASFWRLLGGFFTLVLVVFLRQCRPQAGPADILRPDTRGGLHAIRAKLKSKPVRQGRKRKVAALGKVPQTYDPLRAAFYVSDDYTSLASLQLHYHDLDLLIPEALHAVSARWTLDADQDPKLAAFLQSLQARTPPVDLPVMSMVNNYDAKNNVWCPPACCRCWRIPRHADAAGDGTRGIRRRRASVRESWSTSNPCRNRAWWIFRISSTN